MIKFCLHEKQNDRFKQATFSLVNTRGVKLTHTIIEEYGS